MTWTHRWGIISSIALAQLGIIVGYQTLLTEGLPAASAGQVAVQKTLEAPAGAHDEKSNVPTTPVVSLPSMQEVVPPVAPGQGQPPAVLPNMVQDSNPVAGLPAPPIVPSPILPVAAQTKEDIKLPTVPVDPVSPIPPSSGPPPIPPGPSNVTSRGIPQAPNAGGIPVLPAGANLPGTSVVPPAANAPASPAPGSPWNLTVEIIDGRTHLTAQNGKEVKFTVSCEKLTVQTPGGRIDASGKVKLASNSLEGSCDRLTISWQEDVITLEKAQLKCKLEGQTADVNADQVRLKVSQGGPTFSFFDGF
jgi:hypothetical protein